jgi:hypothetical protein
MLLRRRGVGLLGTMAVGGAAYMAGSSANKRKSNQQAQEQQSADLQSKAADAQKAAPASDSMDEKLEQLQQLGDLRSKGVLTDEEFATQKARILGG